MPWPDREDELCPPMRGREVGCEPFGLVGTGLRSGLGCLGGVACAVGARENGLTEGAAEPACDGAGASDFVVSLVVGVNGA